MIPSPTLKIHSWAAAQKQVEQWKNEGHKIVFTNGCFDLLHLGHIKYLEEAAKLGDKLVIGVNSDASTSRLKGAHRPINEAHSRVYLLASLSFVDSVIEFDEDTPLSLIQLLLPDVLVKGGDYLPQNVVGGKDVIENGGVVKIIEFLKGYSTSKIEAKILKLGHLPALDHESE